MLFLITTVARTTHSLSTQLTSGELSWDHQTPGDARWSGNTLEKQTIRCRLLFGMSGITCVPKTVDFDYTHSGNRISDVLEQTSK